jgi:diaminopropionate ammonia-lyase
LESVGLDTSDYQGRMGHCLGLQLTELPSIMKDEYTVLKENMVLSVEPFLLLNNQKVLVHEECIAITKEGYRLLTTRCPKTPFTIKVHMRYNPDEVNIYPALQHKHHVSPETLTALQEFNEKQPECHAFHQTLSQERTPLLALSHDVSIRELLVKDEGQRFGLKSFKGLGSSFAIHRLTERPQTLCTMTDGNHGKGVAYAAQKMGIPCVVYVPQNMTMARQEAMRDLGARVIVIQGSYDDAISEVRRHASENQWTLLSDTSWEGYTEIPQDIMAGYGTIFREIEEQRQGCEPITHVIIQAGVGGLASAAGAWLHLNSNSEVWSNHVRLIIVEPQGADCIAVNVLHQQNNFENKELISCIGDTNSIMAGLNCGTPSLVSWPILRDIASTFVTIGDNWARRAMKLLHTHEIISGESGAAGVAAVLAAPSLFDEESVILTINTESDTDPETYQDIIHAPRELICQSRL